MKTLWEFKQANKTISLKDTDLLDHWRQAAAQGKQAKWLIRFRNGITLTIEVERDY